MRISLFFIYSGKSRKKSTGIIGCLAAVFMIISLLTAGAVCAQTENTDPLSLWNPGAPKKAIIDFVASVSDPASSEFVPEEERIAVFDLDGTLFCEKPLYLQVLIAAEKLHDLAEKTPEYRDKQPYQGAWQRDWDFISNSGNFLQMNLKAFKGETEEEYKEYALKFLDRNHPRFKVPYLDLFYMPMLQLVKYLDAKGFQVWIVSGSPQEFIRAFSEEKLGVPRDKVIGDVIRVAFREEKGNVTFLREDVIVPPEALREGKPENIRMRIGRNAILAFGNSNDDIAMLSAAGAGGEPHLSLTLHHDDAVREYAYDKGAEKILVIAPKKGWKTVSMKNDFKQVFNP